MDGRRDATSFAADVASLMDSYSGSRDTVVATVEGAALRDGAKRAMECHAARGVVFCGELGVVSSEGLLYALETSCRRSAGRPTSSYVEKGYRGWDGGRSSSPSSNS